MPRPRRLALTLAILAALTPPPTPAAQPPAAATPAPAPASALSPQAFTPLPLGAIRPAGWLKAQLELQAKGLSGHLDEFWPDVKESAWVGGKAEGWERTPYYLDGLVPLAYLLDDPALKTKVKRQIDYILEHQHADGWLGPVGDNDPGHKPYDVWPLFPMFKALAQYQEASGDPRVVPALLKCARKVDEVVRREPLYSWAKFRAADLAVVLYWLHDRTGDAALLDLAARLRSQSHDWRGQFAAGKFPDKSAGYFGLDNHGVNVGMGLKAPGVWSRLGGPDREGDLKAVTSMLKFLDDRHGQATGAFTCDEHLAGRGPSQGTELCTVAEEMYSLEVLLAVTGDANLADRLESLAFNALPATFKKDMCAHQYDQQANQVVCRVSPERVYTDNGPEANLYGLEPNFGCCTANMHQAWPKFAESLWMKTPDGGLAAISYAPCDVVTTIAGKPVRVEVRTDYPFDEEVRITFRTDGPMDFPVHLRMPSWMEAGVLNGTHDRSGVIDPALLLLPDPPKIDGAHFMLLTREGPGTVSSHFYRIDGHFGNKTTWVNRVPMQPSLYRGERGAVAVRRGPLVYSLKIGADWKKLRGVEPFADWEVEPATPWNYALELDPADLAKSLRFEERPVGALPFSTDGAPVVAHARGRRLPGWTLEKNAAAPPPESPVTSDQPLEDLLLIPYGCTDLRVTEFPVLKP